MLKGAHAVHHRMLLNSILKVDTSHFTTQNNVLCGVRNQRTGCAGQGDVNRAVVNHSYVRLLCCGQITNAVLLY